MNDQWRSVRKPRLLHYLWACHPKIRRSIENGCRKLGIESAWTDDLREVLRGEYTILWSPLTWIDPDSLPRHVRILFGPQFFVFPDPSHPACGPFNPDWASRCVFTALSDWVVNCYAEFVPGFRVPVLPLPYGVELERFVPSNHPKTLDVLLYFKHRHPSLLDIARAGLRDRGLAFEEVSYGSYREEEYLEKLGRAKTVLWIGCHESQGFALQEAMSCDVPLLIWDVTSMYEEWTSGRFLYDGAGCGKKLCATAATLWDDRCGIRFTNAAEFDSSLDRMIADPGSYHPRQFVEERLEEGHCLRSMLAAVNHPPF